MKLGCLTNGISDDFREACRIMKRDGLVYADIQFAWGKEIGDHSAEENASMKAIMEEYGLVPAVLSRHNFNGLSIRETEKTSPAYQQHLQMFRHTLSLQKYFNARFVRIMSCAKTPLIWGFQGAGRWIAGNNETWPRLLHLLEEPVRMAEEAGVVLAMETGVFGGLNNGYLAGKFVKELGSSNLKILWDPGNCLNSGEEPWPEGYEYVREHLCHVHIKDLKFQRKRYTAEFTPMGQGDMAPFFQDIADALKKDHYEGIISLENCYEPDGNVYQGYLENITLFQEIFGD